MTMEASDIEIGTNVSDEDGTKLGKALLAAVDLKGLRFRDWDSVPEPERAFWVYMAKIAILNCRLHHPDKTALRAQHKAGQEAMREKAKAYVEGLYDGQPEPIASAGLRFTIMCGIEALPIEDTP